MLVTNLLIDVFQVEELALNSMIRRNNADVQLKTDNKSRDMAKTHTRHTETKVSYFNPYC